MPLSHFVTSYPSPSPYPQVHSLVGLCLYLNLLTESMKKKKISAINHTILMQLLLFYMFPLNNFPVSILLISNICHAIWNLIFVT